MDPLSAIASVVGIISAASAVIKALGPYATAANDAPKIISMVRLETLATRTILTALHQLAMNIFSSENATPVAAYASLIQVDQLIAVLTDGVFLFCELEILLQTLPPAETTGSGARLWSSMQWVRKKGPLVAVLNRMQSFKLSINCMLSILQSDSQIRAESHQQKLISSVDLLLKNNQPLAQNVLIAENIDTIAFDIESRRRASFQSTPPDRRSSIEADTNQSNTNLRNRSSLFELQFEKDLISSRVYRRAKRNTMDFSMRSSIASTHSWSIFSGLSLGNISNISVLALAIYPGDISNAYHYSFGPDLQKPKQSTLSPTVYTRSIFHECVEIELQLSQIRFYDFTMLIAQERQKAADGADPLTVLIRVFRQGHTLLRLFADAYHPPRGGWEHLLVSCPTDSERQRAVAEFVEACVACLGVEPAQCFTVVELMGTDTTNHTKVIRLVELALKWLGEKGAVQAVLFESIPRMFSIDPSPAVLVIDEFLREERYYLARLESLLLASSKIMSSGILQTNSALAAACHQITRTRQLVNAQRSFLLKAEMLALKLPLEQTWDSLFYESLILSGESYFNFIFRQEQVKLALRSALTPTATIPAESQAAILDALGVMGLPAQRLKDYLIFLEELLETRSGSDFTRAMETLQTLLDDANTRAAEAILLDGLEEAEKFAISQLGKPLLFDHTYVISPPSRGVLKTQTLLYERAIVQFQKRSPDLSQPLFSIVRIIKVTDLIGSVVASRQGMAGFEVKWVRGGILATSRIFIGLRLSRPRPERWTKALREIQTATKAEASVGRLFRPHPSRLDRPCKLAVLGSNDAEKHALTIQLTQGYYDAGSATQDSYKSYEKELVVDGYPLSLEILEIVAEDALFPTIGEALREHSMRAADGFLLVFNLTSRQSFEQIPKFLRQILAAKDKDSISMVVVGNICSPESGREVSRQECFSLVQSIGCPYYEASAKKGVNVEEPFSDLVRQVRWREAP